MAEAEVQRSQVFREQRPPIADEDAMEAARAGRIGVSFNALPVFTKDGKVLALAVKWKLGNGATETIVIDRYPSTVLLLLFERLRDNDWTGTILVPDSATPQ